MSTYTYTCANPTTPHMSRVSLATSAHNDGAALAIKCPKCSFTAYQSAGADSIVGQTVPGGALKPNGQKNLL